MKVTLCYPALIPGHKPTYGLQPLGVLYIAALLKREGFDVEVLDADVDGLTVQETAERVLATNPDLVGLSMMTPQLITGLAVAALVKAERPEVLVALGGAHIDSTKEDTFAMADCFDFAVHGEGEYTLLEICQNIQQYGTEDFDRCVAEVPNAIYRSKEMGEVVVNPPRMFLKQLDELPSVDFDMVDIKKYSIPTMAGRFVVSMMLSRGCPFKCTFCDAPITMGTKLRFWSIERVLADIKYYKERYGVTNFVFKDSTFTAKKRWAFEFCHALVDSGLDIKWRCNTRANLVQPDLLELMAKAGCYVINFGVESGHPEILKRIKKEVDLDEVRDAHDRCRKLGIRTYSTFLMGNPGETAETAQATIDFSKTIRPSLAMFFVSTAYPGTPMYDEAVEEGKVVERWWAKQEWDASKNTAFEVRWGWTDAGALQTPGFAAEAWQKKATREFYLRPQFIWDTFVFTIKNPYFIRHIWNLGTEILPFYKLKNLLPGGGSKNPGAGTRDGCPSLPNPGYAPRISSANDLSGNPAAEPKLHTLQLKQEGLRPVPGRESEKPQLGE